MDIIAVGAELKAARRQARLSQTALAQSAGLTRSRLDAIENGRAAEVGVKYLLRALNAVGLDLRVTTLNAGRPTLEDLWAELEEAEDAPRLG